MSKVEEAAKNYINAVRDVLDYPNRPASRRRADSMNHASMQEELNIVMHCAEKALLDAIAESETK